MSVEAAAASQRLRLADLAGRLRQTLGILHKRDIQTAAAKLGNLTPPGAEAILLGDDCAAIPDRDGYLLFAAEGLWPVLLELEPWFAGWCAVLVNVNDVYAMGGRPMAVVDALWSGSHHRAALVWDGMLAASKAFQVPIVVGHTNCHSPYEALSVAILGRAQQLLTSFDAHPGDLLVLAADFDGRQHPNYPFWDAATMKDPVTLQANLELLPKIAEAGLCKTSKDVSMGGVIGTTLMLMETSGCGAMIDLDAISCPVGVPLDAWLVSFPSYGFLLSLPAENLKPVQSLFRTRGLVCEPIGQISEGATLTLKSGQESVCFWDLNSDPLTGFSKHRVSKR